MPLNIAAKYLCLRSLGGTDRRVERRVRHSKVKFGKKYKDSGNVQMLGLDVYRGSRAQVEGFRANGGITFPMLLKCTSNSREPIQS